MSGISKKVPNPDGKKGSIKHQNKIKEEFDSIEKSGLEAETEHRIKFPDGTVNYIDVAGIDNTGNPAKFVQVGVQTKKGNPVAREQRIIDKIKRFFKIPVTFVPYKTLGDKDNL